jgi:translocation and assembly module TamB
MSNEPTHMPVQDIADDAAGETEVANGRGRNAGSSGGRGRKWLRGIAVALAALVALLGLFLIGLNSDAGRRFVVTQIEKMEFENGMKIDIGRLDGSLYGEMLLRDFKLLDPNGVFLTSPEIRVDWRPFSFLSNHLNIKSATSRSISLSRLPEFKDTPPSDAPLLPDLDIDVAALRVDQLVLGEAISGRKQVLRLAGKVAIADGRAQVQADADTIGELKGDRLKLILDAVPDANKLIMSADIVAPQGGAIAAMAGLEKPLTAKLDGRGDWKAWDGALTASLGEQPVADLSLKARDGQFALKGDAKAAEFVTENLRAALAPTVAVDLTAKLTERKAFLDGQLASDAVRLDVKGGVDLGESRYDKLALDLQVIRPAAVLPQIQANALRVSAVLDGKFALPIVDYQAQAARIAVNDIVVERLTLAGKARVDADQIIVPVAGRAAAIRGLDAAAGGTLVDVRLDGDLAYKDGRLLSDNLRLRSPRIDAKAIIIADFNRAFYTGAIDGRINDYRIDSVGVFNIDTDMDLETAPNGGFALAGNVRARSTRLFNSGMRDVTGGNIVASSAVRYGTDGIVRFSNLRMTSPKLRITSGQGSYAPSGQLALTARANSTDYGPLDVAVTGTITNPRATLRAERPGLGIGLTNLLAQVNGADGGYRLTATGDTDYGPLSADVLLLMQKGPLTLDIARADLAGVGFSGRLVQSAAGPFVGQLDASGNGLGGVVRLDGDGQYQTVKANIRANDVVMPGAAQLAIGSAIIDADVTLYDTPHIVADVQIADTRYQAYHVAVGRAKIDYRDGSGRVQALLEGTSGVPFRVALNGDLAPEQWRVALNGRASGVNFRTQNPARIAITSAGYELLPTTVDLGRGSRARLSGRYGDDGLIVQSRLDRVNMALLNNAFPDMGLGGHATGSIDFVQQSANNMPQADVRLSISDFTRTTAVAVSQPMDVNLVAQLKNDGGDVRAVMRQRGTVIGRLQAVVKPFGGGSNWSERLMAAPLSGGFRYNGPSETLYSFAGPAQQAVSGPIAVAADFRCVVNSPCLEGVIHGKDMVYENQAFGTRLTGMTINGRFNGDRLLIENMTAKAGDGSIEANGFISFAAAQGYPMNISARLQKARLARSDNLGAEATGDLQLLKSAGETAILSGDLRIPEARYKYVREGAASVPSLTGVRRKPALGRPRVTGDRLKDVGGGLFDLIRLDIRLRANEQLYVSGMGLESEWQADVRLQGTTETPRIAGEVELVRGTLGFAGRSFTLEEGHITFPDGNAFDPAITLVATETIENVDVSVNVSGRAQNPTINFSSTPGLPQDEIVSRILFGESITNLSPVQAVQLATSLNGLRGGGGLNPLGALQSAAGIDRLRVLGADESEGRGTAIAAGQYISKDIYLEVITDGRGYTATQLEISLTRALSILSQAGGSGQTNMSVRYRKDY